MNTTDSKGIFLFFNRLGPGLLLAATSIGASHLVFAPRAGASFEYKLLWLVLLAHLFKYHAFEFGPRYAAATGQSLIAGYMRLPGPRGWALWIFLFGTISQGIAVLAGVVGIAAAVLHTFVGRMPFAFYAAVVILTVLAFLLFGGYRWLDFLNKIMMTVLFTATVTVFVPVFPAPKVFVNFVVPSVPIGSIALVAAILGWMPTGIDVSIWHSLWTLQKHPELASVQTPDRRRAILRFALADMRIGYVLSFVVAAVFLLLAAMFLYNTESKIEGVGFSKSLADLYVDRIGPWMYPVFMVTAFFAMYSTTYTVIDGFSRSFAETLSTLFGEMQKKWWARLYWIFVLFTAVLAFVLIVTIGKPVKLVMYVAFISFSVAPLYYGLNYYCVTRFVNDEALRPKKPARVIAVVGIVLMLLAALVCMAQGVGLLK